MSTKVTKLMYLSDSCFFNKYKFTTLLQKVFIRRFFFRFIFFYFSKTLNFFVTEKTYNILHDPLDPLELLEPLERLCP